MDSIPGNSRQKEIIISKKELFTLIHDCVTETIQTQIQHLEERLEESNNHEVRIHSDAYSKLSKIFYKFRTMWQACSRNNDYFFKKHESWLSSCISIPLYQEIRITQGGRPSISFELASERTKRRRTEELRKENSASQLLYAAQMNLRSCNNSEAAKIVKDVFENPTKANSYIQALNSKPVTQLPIDKALSMIVEAKLSRQQYNTIRAIINECSSNLLPNYETVRKAKISSYPPRSQIIITEHSAEAMLQPLLDHTVERILKVQDDVLHTLSLENETNITLISKWGCDGSSGQSEYKQKFNDETVSDSSIFLTSFVPLRLVSYNEIFKKETIIWNNPRPSSPRFCRPIRVQLIQENSETTVNEMNYINQQIQSLVPFSTTINGKHMSVSYKMFFTMVDGKVCNAVSSNKSTLRCYLCGATAKNFNDIDSMLKQKVNESYLQFGISSLHAWIRLFECLLHLSYKLDVKKWQIRSEEDKKTVKDRKIEVQKGFKLQLGLRVDYPKCVYGSSNDANTARRFFENSIVSASITGLDINIVQRFHIILQVISSGYTVDIKKFKIYGVETAKLFVQLYPWYMMPNTVHKILIHGPQIIANALLPIGQLSEEAQEARNKDIKNYRRNFSRKCSREKTMEDVFNWLLLSSDPLISSLRKLPRKKLRSLSPEAISLLICPAAANSNEESSDSDSDC